MRVLVSDTSILIDLERASLLRAAFSLDAEFVVPDLLYERELRDSGGADLLALGLRVETLDEGEVESVGHTLSERGACVDEKRSCRSGGCRHLYVVADSALSTFLRL